MISNSKEKLMELLKILNSDEKKAKEFANQKTKGDTYEYCKTLVDGYTKEEYMEFMTGLSNLLKNIPDENAPIEISDKDLETISGGFLDFETIKKAYETGKNLAPFISELFS